MTIQQEKALKNYMRHTSLSHLDLSSYSITCGERNNKSQGSHDMIIIRDATTNQVIGRVRHLGCGSCEYMKGPDLKGEWVDCSSPIKAGIGVPDHTEGVRNGIEKIIL